MMVGRGIATVGIWMSPAAVLHALVRPGIEISTALPSGLVLVLGLILLGVMVLATLIVWTDPRGGRHGTKKSSGDVGAEHGFGPAIP